MLLFDCHPTCRSAASLQVLVQGTTVFATLLAQSQKVRDDAQQDITTSRLLPTSQLQDWTLQNLNVTRGRAESASALGRLPNMGSKQHEKTRMCPNTYTIAVSTSLHAGTDNEFGLQ
jgi:hypothetical protein